MRNSEVYIGFAGPEGSGAPLEKRAAPLATQKTNEALAKAVEEVEALPDGPSKIGLRKRLVELTVALRAREIAILRGKSK